MVNTDTLIAYSTQFLAVTQTSVSCVAMEISVKAGSLDTQVHIHYDHTTSLGEGWAWVPVALEITVPHILSYPWLIFPFPTKFLYLCPHIISYKM